jgi:CTP:phosphocholine cytidylyltransferase-like protein
MFNGIKYNKNSIKGIQNPIRNTIPIKRVESPQYPTSVIIPAAAPGHRMKYAGIRSLIQINGKSLLDLQINSINQSIKDCEIIVIIGFEYEKIIKQFLNKYPNIRFVYNPLYEFNNIGLSIQLGLYNAIYPNTLIIYGDLLFSKTYLNGVIGEKSKILFDTNTLPDGGKIGGIITGGKVTNLGFGLSPVFSQIVYFVEKEKRIMMGLVHEDRIKKMFGFEIISCIIDEGGEFLPRISKEYIREIDTLTDYNKVIK